MEGEERSQLISQFCNITSVDENRANFYLRSSDWQINLALASFYDNDDDDVEIFETDAEKATEDMQESAKPEQKPKKINQPSGSSNRFATLQTIGDDSSSQEEEEGQAFYAGGSERSGQQVLGPPRKKTNDLIRELLKSAEDQGAAEDVPAVERDAAESKAKQAFQGTGFRLGATADYTEIVNPSSSLPRQQSQVNLTLNLWKNGFSMNGGPLRDYSDPENKEFLATVHKGEIPQELIRESKGNEVNLNVKDHRNEDFQMKNPKVKSFSGVGHMLGSPVPTLVTSGSSNMNESSESKKATASVEIDESLPTTNIQIRLADGSRLVAKFNHSHKISDIRQYIVSSRPEFSTSTFTLMTTFPNKELSDDSVTLAEANLLNAVIMQKIT